MVDRWVEIFKQCNIETNFKGLKVNIFKSIICKFKGHIHTVSKCDSVFSHCARCNCQTLEKETYEEIQKIMKDTVINYNNEDK
jgi:hypothetical protein